MKSAIGPDDISFEEIERLTKLSKDAAAAAATLSDREARYLVDTYYRIQDNRKRTNSQTKALAKRDEPNALVGWLAGLDKNTENSIKSVLLAYAKSNPVGVWATSNYGIGPVIAAGLLAYIDITKAPTVGHIWSFAGLNPNIKWEKGQKRPFSADLRCLCWKIGMSFLKFSNNAKCFYGHLYKERKEQEWARNLSGALASEAERALATKNFDKKTVAYKFYSGQMTPETVKAYLDSLAPKAEDDDSEDDDEQIKLTTVAIGKGAPMLPPLHIDARARRWVVKLFLSHWHHVAYREHFKTDPPFPYILTQDKGHAHYIAPPGYEAA